MRTSTASIAAAGLATLSCVFPSEGRTALEESERRVYGVVPEQGGAYMLYMDADRTHCIDALPSSEAIRLRLDEAADEDWISRPNQSLRVKVRLEKREGFQASLQVIDDEVVVSSAGGIFYEGRQIFLHCQDYSTTNYEVYFVEQTL